MDIFSAMKQLVKVLAINWLFLLLLPAPATAQDATLALTSLVRITCTRGGEPRPPGSGFIVAIEGDRATIVTASHVIEGARCEVEFTVAAYRLPVARILGLEASDRHGLAALQVRGVPTGVTVLVLDADTPVFHGEELLLAGFPQRTSTPRVKQGVFSGPEGKLLLVDRPAGEGASGGPVLRGGKAVGVITAGGVGEEYTSAVSARVAQAILEGWRVRPGTVKRVMDRPPESLTLKPECLPGRKRTYKGIDFVRICGGTLTMGSADDDQAAERDEKPAHEMTLSEFWIARYETTNRQYRRFYKDHNSAEANDLPAVGISWNEARAFCERLGFRLPTEAEWEYAARAGSRTAWSFGNDESDLGRHAWYVANSQGKAHPVGTREANGWELHDMHGNVWEWVTDSCGDYSREPQIDPDDAMLRGGGFFFKPGYLRSARRFPVTREFRSRGIGFRCARNARR